MGKPLIDETGKRYAHWEVLYRVLPNKNNNAVWLCRCDCGTVKPVQGNLLRNGTSRSCCFRGRQKNVIPVSHRPEYTTYYAMRSRCLTSTHPDYPTYGGRGIGICASWLESFDNFLRDVGEQPTPQHTLDRYPNNNGNYEPGNVRWATPKEQAQNRNR